jgi:lipopolysaccharide export system protein LptA
MMRDAMFRGAMLRRAMIRPGWFAAVVLLVLAHAAAAQPLDLTHGGPITITATDGLEWRQVQQEVIARGNATAVRGNVTVVADRLIAFYRKKAPAPGTPAQPPAVHPAAATSTTGQPNATATGATDTDTGATDATDTGDTEIFRLRAEGNVHIYTTTDQAQGDLAVYDIDQAVMVMTGHDLKLTTPNEVLTARDSLEYWTQKHMAVARGNAVVVTKDARRVAADVLVAYTTDTGTPASGAPAAAAKPASPPAASGSAAATPAANASDDDLAQSGKLEKVDAFGRVSIRTPTDTATGDRAVYVPDTGIARLAGNVRITRGQNQLNGQEAEVNMKTGVARLLRGDDARVTGLVVPGDTSSRNLPGGPPSPAGTASSGATSPGATGTSPRKPTGTQP